MKLISNNFNMDFDEKMKLIRPYLIGKATPTASRLLYDLEKRIIYYPNGQIARYL